ncbi:MAG: hypothetical protein ACTSU5_15430 [Promethearchaeota archaeon]
MSEIWDELLDDLGKNLDKAIARIEERDIDDIPGAKEALIRRLGAFRSQYAENDGFLLKKLIKETIEDTFFPQVDDLTSAFRKILAARTQEQDFIIEELITGFVVSETRGFGMEREGTILDRFVEAFRKSKNFTITDQQFFNLFGNPSRPRKYVREGLDKLVEFFGLEVRENVIEKDLRTSGKRVYRTYAFPQEIMEVLNGKYIEVNPDTGNTVVFPEFDKTVLTSLLLAHWAVNRHSLKKYTINGICDILTLILLLGMLPALKLDENDPLNREDTFDPSRMSVVPKSWMMQNVLLALFLPLVKIVAYMVGGPQWTSKIEASDVRKKVHEQIRFLIKDVNKWILGNLCRVEIPIFVEISNIFVEITVGITDEEE